MRKTHLHCVVDRSFHFSLFIPTRISIKNTAQNQHTEQQNLTFQGDSLLMICCQCGCVCNFLSLFFPFLFCCNCNITQPQLLNCFYRFVSAGKMFKQSCLPQKKQILCIAQFHDFLSVRVNATVCTFIDHKKTVRQSAVKNSSVTTIFMQTANTGQSAAKLSQNANA